MKRTGSFPYVRAYPRVHQFMRPHNSRRFIGTEWHFESSFGEITARFTAKNRAWSNGPRSRTKSVLAARDQLRIHIGSAHESLAIVKASRNPLPTSLPNTRWAALGAPNR